MVTPYQYAPRFTGPTTMGVGSMGIGATRGFAPTDLNNRIRDLVSSFSMPSSGYVPSMNNNGAGRPVGSTVAAPRSEGVAAQMPSMFATRSSNATGSTQSLADWTKEFLGSRPRAKKFADEEMTSIGRLYGSGAGSLQGDLSNLRSNRSAAIRDLTESAMRRAGRADSLRRMTGGNNSYNDQLYAQQLGEIAASTAASDSDQARDDLFYLDQARRGSVGARGALLDQNLNRDLLPARMSNEFETMNLDRLGQLSSIDQGNNSYIPAEDAYTRRINFINYLKQFPS